MVLDAIVSSERAVVPRTDLVGLDECPGPLGDGSGARRNEAVVWIRGDAYHSLTTIAVFVVVAVVLNVFLRRSLRVVRSAADGAAGPTGAGAPEPPTVAPLGAGPGDDPA